ncbi:ECF transporter S component [Brevibacillus sp. SYSU BS000544]|uniref:ECF transporter S component n=1 Tax=Brevibacillus sp. SYSU BS000544 TaxID=3416443 RepID=UPI003CE598CD
MQQTQHVGQLAKTRKLVAIPLFAAVAFILQYLEFPLPLIPTFLKLDFSTLPGLIGGLMFGPVAGIMIELIKNILHLLLKNTDGLLVGEIANFIAGASYISVAIMIQRMINNKLGFAVGLSVGTILMTVIMSIANYFVLIPAYAALYSMPVDALLQTFQMSSLWSLIIKGIAPFNMIKGIAVAIVAYLIYVKLSPRLRMSV